MTTGGASRVCEAGDSILVNPREASSTRITGASRAAPYLALAFRLDAQLAAEVAVEIAAANPRGNPREPACTRHDVAQTAVRMMQLLDRPSALAVLGPQLRREMHYWLLAGHDGPALQRTLQPKRHAGKIARAIGVIRSEFRSPISSGRLAAAAGLGLSAFYRSFREVTAVSPLQYQKRLRLAEARRLLLGERLTVSDAAYNVGYESVPQFVRDYRRLFGATPGDTLRKRIDPPELPVR